MSRPTLSFDDLLARYGRPVPRYTSYPTALQFNGTVDAARVEGWLAAVDGSQPVSLYLHMPYCKKMCLYCGCNMKVTHNPAVITEYVGYLMREIAMVAGKVGKRLPVSVVHLGGGTPNYAPDHALELLFQCLRANFDILPTAELSLEADPRHLDPATIVTLARLGINRASLGIQDTNPAVQSMIGREQPHTLNIAAVEGLRAAGIEAVNVDLVYGLPGQTVQGFAASMGDIIALNPSRLALFGYAHVPWMKKHQQVLEQYPRADSAERWRMFETATAMLTAAGYVAVGIDHFAKPDDPLAEAAADGKLGRNFMGYTTDTADTLLGFGASSISSFTEGYAQNVTAVADYTARIAGGILPVERGVAVTARDAALRAAITALVSNFQYDMAALGELEGDIRPRLAPLEDDGLIRLDGRRLHITPAGRPFARVVAACFDDYVQPAAANRHSQAV